MESTTDYEHYFATLNDLREEGSINMMSAPSVLREKYGLNRDIAYDIFKAWTKSLRPKPFDNTINYPIANQFDHGEEDLNGEFAEPVLVKNDYET
jgi:hypothetical protein